MLQLVDVPLQASNMPAGGDPPCCVQSVMLWPRMSTAVASGNWAYATAGLLIAQMRWLLWKVPRAQ